MDKFLKLMASAAIVNLATGSLAMAQEDPITLGVQVPTTGSEATYGKDMFNAISLAADEINADGGLLGGRQIELVTGDTACDPQQSVNAASRLASQEVVGVVGGYCSGATQPTLKIYGDANIPFVIVAANSTQLIPANPGNAVMINSTGNDQAKTALDFFEGKGIEKLAIVNQGDAYSQDLANLTRDAWTKAGHTVSAFEYVNKGEQDFSALVNKIRGSGAEAVFWTAYYADGGLLIRQLRQRGFQGTIAVGDGSNSPELFNIAGQAAEGVFAFSNPTADFLPAAQQFISDYRSTFDNAPGPYAPLAYDGLQLMVWAINQAGSTDADAIIKALNSADGQEWLAGPISFTPQHTLARSNFVVLEGQGGKWTRYEK
ncbi:MULTISPECIES: branched-chain amino acid ABC transporter substrate-binding protein [Halomonadaceae]|uniref:Branched-chain amino acid ABC transporter substrate-binding protein n=1 Tax=Modicisalibacter zincidurans TaxID=1178777 RepID=A0ABP9REV9_9GAMM|nr:MULTISPECIES: branched-chain amino acid ABC transporter substrate-binding protein [Halomonas]MCD6007497.1 branched-chain amino acid ABC transporter substrate-binding protein [Halomonas sp. IOP_31]MEA3251594.1 branched-chain amino acid ABC transporter substrate-binding protein [Pseudomonadota bacterium]